jgi:hypothetical protein
MPFFGSKSKQGKLPPKDPQQPSSSHQEPPKPPPPPAQPENPAAQANRISEADNKIIQDTMEKFHRQNEILLKMIFDNEMRQQLGYHDFKRKINMQNELINHTNTTLNQLIMRQQSDSIRSQLMQQEHRMYEELNMIREKTIS